MNRPAYVRATDPFGTVMQFDSYESVLEARYRGWLGCNAYLKQVERKISYHERLIVYAQECNTVCLTARDLCQGKDIDLTLSGPEKDVQDVAKGWGLMLSLMKEDCELCVEVMVHSAKHASVEVFQTLVDHIEGCGWNTEECDFQGTATFHKHVWGEKRSMMRNKDNARMRPHYMYYSSNH